MHRRRTALTLMLPGVLAAAVLPVGGPAAQAATGRTAAVASSTGLAGAASAAACSPVFSSAFAASLARDFPGQRATASVYDTRTGCWYSLHPGMRITTASVIKAAVMGAVLLRAQDKGRGSTSWERARIGPMITYSYNNPQVSDLLGRVGGVRGMDRFDRRSVLLEIAVAPVADG